jgi:hypothetical protein
MTIRPISFFLSFFLNIGCPENLLFDFWRGWKYAQAKEADQILLRCLSPRAGVSWSLSITMMQCNKSIRFLIISRLHRRLVQII